MSQRSNSLVGANSRGFVGASGLQIRPASRAETSRRQEEVCTSLPLWPGAAEVSGLVDMHRVLNLRQALLTVLTLHHGSLVVSVMT